MVDPDLMADVTVILQNWITGGLTLDRFRGLAAAVTSATGLVGRA
jgi:hypothetical protein